MYSLVWRTLLQLHELGTTRVVFWGATLKESLGLVGFAADGGSACLSGKMVVLSDRDNDHGGGRGDMMIVSDEFGEEWRKRGVGWSQSR